MNELKPTSKLRFVARTFETVADNNFYGKQPTVTRTINVLQQWWATYNGWAEVRGEWRDVTLEIEGEKG